MITWADRYPRNKKLAWQSLPTVVSQLCVGTLSSPLIHHAILAPFAFSWRLLHWGFVILGVICSLRAAIHWELSCHFYDHSLQYPRSSRGRILCTAYVVSSHSVLGLNLCFLASPSLLIVWKTLLLLSAVASFRLPPFLCAFSSVCFLTHYLLFRNYKTIIDCCTRFFLLMRFRSREYHSQIAPAHLASFRGLSAKVHRPLFLI